MAVIGSASPDELIRASWGQAVADELNSRTVKNNVPGQNMDGALIIVSAATPALRLRRSDATAPYLTFESNATGNAQLGFIQGTLTGMRYEASDTGDTHNFYVNSVLVAALSAGEFDISGSNLVARTAVLARNDDANQILIADYDAGTAGDTAHAFISFYPDATSATVFGTRGGYVGYNGTGFQVRNDVGNVTVAANGIATVSSATSGVVLEADSVVIVTADGMYIGKTVYNDDLGGTHIFTSTVGTAPLRNSIRNTVTAAGTPNIYLRRNSTAAADGQIFIDFTTGTGAGTRVGRIEQVGTGGAAMVSGSDYRLKDDLGPITDAVERINLLQPKRMRWKTGAMEFDGFLAHEVEPAAPYAVRGTKDAVLPLDDPNNPGGIDPQGLIPDALVALLTAALQEALAKIDTLEARVAALEGTP